MLSSSFFASSPSSTGGLAFLDDVLRPAHRGGRIGAGENLADDQPVEQHADRREVLLDGRRAVAAAENLDVGGDVMRAHRRERRDVLGVEPGEERAHGDGVGGAGVRVADVGGEEIEKPQAGVLAGVGDQSRHQHRGCGSRPDDDRRRHDDRERLVVDPDAMPRRRSTPRI